MPLSKIPAVGVDATGTPDSTTFFRGDNTWSNPVSTGSIGIAQLSATGTPSASTFLRGDNTWATPASSVTSGTAVSASGTSVNFTGLPSTVKRITVVLNGVSTNGTSNIQIQIGSGSVSTSGYLGSYVQLASGGNSVGAMTTGFMVSLVDATTAQVGQAVITNISGNSWVCTALFGRTNQNVVMNSGGSITLGGVLDRVRITTVNGTDTFDAGTINILYE